jgi:hypothetical protein
LSRLCDHVYARVKNIEPNERTAPILFVRLVHRPNSYLHYYWFRLELLVHAESRSRCLARPDY